MRSVVVVFPASMCAMIPMLRIRASEVDRATWAIEDGGWRAAERGRETSRDRSGSRGARGGPTREKGCGHCGVLHQARRFGVAACRASRMRCRLSRPRLLKKRGAANADGAPRLRGADAG